MRNTNYTLLTSIFAALFAFVPIPANGDDPPKGDKVDPEALVKQLGDEDFAAREEASRRLLNHGIRAQDALRAGARSADREIRYRCLRILQLVRENDFQKRLARFSRGQDAEQPLPGWAQFKKQFGDSTTTRELFVEMQQAEPELMRAIEQGPTTLANVLNFRAQKLDLARRRYQYKLSTGDIAALLFAAGDPVVEVAPSAASSINQFCGTHGFSSSSTLGPHKESMRKLLGRWVRRGSGWGAYRSMELARKFGLREGLTPAERIIRANNNQTNTKQLAVLTIAKLGDKSHIPLLRSLLDDPTICSTQRFSRGRKNYQLQGQLRDVALASILHLLGEDPLKFGFDQQLARDPETIFEVNSIGFVSQEARDVAFSKWRDYDKRSPEQAIAKPEEPEGKDSSQR